MIKAIETSYSGYRFRSRLEARWATFFDALGILWEYEKEGYSLGAAGWYLPDFWLSTVNMWAEVKGGNFTGEEIVKCSKLAVHTGHPCLMLSGTPEVKLYWATEIREDDEDPTFENYALSNYGNYPQAEHRFFANLWQDYDDPQDFKRTFSDMDQAVNAARSARFEHGEKH